MSDRLTALQCELDYVRGQVDLAMKSVALEAKEGWQDKIRSMREAARSQIEELQRKVAEARSHQTS